jgi:XapX domain-containing protein
MKFILGLLISFAVGVGCRYFDIPVGSPPVIPGALLVLAMTLGYSSTDKILNRRHKPATTARLCGGPTGATTENTQRLAPDDIVMNKLDRPRPYADYDAANHE